MRPRDPTPWPRTPVLGGLLVLALAGIVIWVALCAWSFGSLPRRRATLGTVLALAPCLANIAAAARSTLARSGAMPLNEFVETYVRFRHPHHYDPSSWPIERRD